MENANLITDATLIALRRWVEFPQNPTSLEEVYWFRAALKEIIGADVKLTNFRFNA